MLTVTGPGLSASSCSRLPAANRVRGRVGPVQPAGAVLVRAVCRTAAAAAEPAAAALLLFCINLQLMCCWRATPPFLLLCLFRRDGMTEQQDWWRGEDGGGGGGVLSVWTGPGVPLRSVTQIL